MIWEAVWTQPPPWVTDAIGSSPFFAFVRAEVLLVLTGTIAYPRSPRPLPSIVWGCHKLVNQAGEGLWSNLLLLLTQPRVVD